MKKRYLVLALSSCILLSGCNFKFSIGETQTAKTETTAEVESNKEATEKEESKESEPTEGVSEATAESKETSEVQGVPTKLEETTSSQESEEETSESDEKVVETEMTTVFDADAVKNVVKYENVLKSLKRQLEEMKKSESMLSTEVLSPKIDESVFEDIKKASQNAKDFKKSMKDASGSASGWDKLL